MPITITVDAPTADEIQALANAAAGLGGTISGGGDGDNGGGTSPPVVDYFPVDSTAAPFPSPENSTMTVLNGVIGGKPYLRSSTGAIYQFAKSSAGTPVSTTNGSATGWEATINGQPIMGPYAPITPQPVYQMIVRQGGVYFQTQNQSGWGFSKADSPNGWSIVSLPPASGTLPPPPPAMPADPTPAVPAPGSSGNVVLAGPSQTIKTLAAAVAAAKAGDTIRLDAGAVFAESVQLTVPLLIDGQGTVANPGTATAAFSGGAILDGSTFTSYAFGKGGLVPAIDIIVQGLEIRGFGLKETTTGATSGVRTTGSGGITVQMKNCYVHDNQDGVASGGSGASDWIFTDCLFANNGIGDGLSHNIYIGNEGVHVTLSGVTSIVQTSVADATRATNLDGGGHALKTRAHALTITGTNYFAAADATAIDIPDGTTQALAISAGTTLHKGAADDNHGTIGYASESQKNGAVGGKAAIAFDVQCASPFTNIAAGSVDFTGSTRTGNAITNTGGGTVVALP